MPGGDRTGPRGLGPMTGRAAGLCAGAGVPGSMNPQPGRGFGKGRGFGGGRRRGGPAVTPNLRQERGCLEDRATALQERLDAVHRRLNELTPTPPTE